MILFKQIIAFLFPLLVLSRIVFDKPSKWNNPPGWPAVKIRLTKFGAEHVKSVGVKILNEEIPKLSGFQTQHSFYEHGITGTVQLYDVNVLGYSPPEYTSIDLAPPSYVILQLDGMGITLAGRFSGMVALLPITGSVIGDIRRMTVRLKIHFRTAPDGLMQVKVNDCSTIVPYSHFSISADGILSGFVKTIEAMINEAIKKKIPSIFCNSLQNVIEDNSPRLFQYEGDPRSTPFNPPVMLTTNDSSRMIYFYGSEYLFNSLLFHAYEGDRMIVEIDESVLPKPYKSVVRTSCERNDVSVKNFLSSLCLGTLIPELAIRYPNMTSSFVLLPHQVPEFGLSRGVTSIDLKSLFRIFNVYFSGRILIYIDEGNRKKQILVTAADLQADLRLLVENEKFAAALKLNKFDVSFVINLKKQSMILRLHRSAVRGLNGDSIAQLAPLAKTFLGPQLAKALKKGVPFPLKDSVEFIDPQVIVHDRFIEVATDFRLGEKKLREKIKEAFSLNFSQLKG
ncbi:unnamed protein product [Thelazia callipaeda]|uniref:BPI2 domain-containing protein n=1 Tax=Thelazia callipaeda TaxID=103827 RepID=A0A158RBC9_THECL|nr:unnamed protein product [Thelazia callipaeda]